MSKRTRPQNPANKVMGFGPPGTFDNEAQEPEVLEPEAQEPEVLEPEEQLPMVIPDGQLAGIKLDPLVAGVLFPTEEPVKEDVFTGVPFLQFFHPGAKNASTLLVKCPMATEKSAFIVSGSTPEDVVILAPDFKFTILTKQQYVAYIDSESGQHSGVEFGFKNPRSTDKKENILSITLVDTGEEFYFTLTTWRSTKCPAAKIHSNYIAGTQNPRWLSDAVGQEKEIRATLVGSGIPPAFRAWSQVILESRTAVKSNRDYELGSARPATADVSRVHALIESLTVGRGQVKLADCVTAYSDRMEYLRENV